MITAWVLAASIGLPWAWTVSGIASEAACQDLMKRIAADSRWAGGQAMACYPYQAPGLAVGAPVAGSTPNSALSTDANGNLAQRDVLTPN